MFDELKNKNDVLILLTSGDLSFGDHQVMCSPEQRELIKNGILTYKKAYEAKHGKAIPFHTWPDIGPGITINWWKHEILKPEDVMSTRAAVEFAYIVRLPPGGVYEINQADYKLMCVIRSMCSRKGKGLYSVKPDYPAKIIVTRLSELRRQIRDEALKVMENMQEGEMRKFICDAKELSSVRASQSQMKQRGITIKVIAHEDGCYLERHTRFPRNNGKTPMLTEMIARIDDDSHTITEEQYEQLLREWGEVNRIARSRIDIR